jgi:hypothetical protein
MTRFCWRVSGADDPVATAAVVAAEGAVATNVADSFTAFAKEVGEAAAAAVSSATTPAAATEDCGCRKSALLRADDADLFGFDGATDPDASADDASACEEATVADDDEDNVDDEGVDATAATGAIEATVRAGSAETDVGAGRNDEEEDDDDGVGKSILGDK